MAGLEHLEKHAPAVMRHSQSPFLATTFAAITLFPMATLIETTHPKQSPKCYWNKIVQA